MIKREKIGIIAEDDSDVVTAFILIKRIADKEYLSLGGKFTGKGCGRIKRKCNSWANNLKDRGCLVLFVIHDLDDKDVKKLEKEIREALQPSPISKYLICIPIQEIEAWLLSDPNAIKIALGLKKIPKIKKETENIPSPKEYLGDVVYKTSGKEKIYINTKHNETISRVIDINIIKKHCPSFIPFFNFIKNIY